MVSQPLTIYYRNGCHLCEELAALLYRGWPQQTEDLEWLDVDSNDDWRARFGDRIPVLMSGENLICDLKPDPERISRYFGKPIIPL